ncbi:FAD-dependent oxidoreductase [Acrocarpospora phusangensis]|uniref:FAD-dependent oxidoreductase n=1 Tax=Acrocarpospora phusangensis TaxID=1070424 RepID=A0A919UQY8_9ACTN|nr:NAD(P)/FAD-dependent oxidoreductase [Acrocarpospora phusangensis]GIH25025.1 FAD-dependent oxidoreductase [Acrocarpospora phusangensis]
MYCPIRYDAVVVGARCAGAATAMLLARAGLRVLVVDRAGPGTDTLSTHALMRGGVLQLAKWGLLEDVIMAGTPAITRTAFDYGVLSADIAIRSSPGVPALYAPRRTVLDALLLRHAAEAGADVALGVDVTGVRRDRHGRVCGVTGRERRRAFDAYAPIVIGADGVRSTVAKAVAAPVTRRGLGAGALWYTHVTGLPNEGYRWFYRPGATAGLIPTNAGATCVFAGMPAARFGESRRSTPRQALADAFARAAPNAATELRAAVPAGPVRGWPGLLNFTRQAYGPGWALVGDAGYFKDPLGTHGITQALRDAQLLADAIVTGHGGTEPLESSLTRYARTRDDLSADMFAATDALASYDWNLAEARHLLRHLSAAMSREVEFLSPVPLATAGRHSAE